jgi:hypothetical protein
MQSAIKKQMMQSAYSSTKQSALRNKEESKELAIHARMSETAQTPCFLATPAQLTGQNWNKPPVINVHITNNITLTDGT